MAKVKMISLMTFAGREGLILRGKEFEAENERRAEELEKAGLAAYYQDGEGFDLEEILKGLNSHAKVDEFAELNKLVIPSKDSGAKLEERKAAIVEALENAAK